VREYPFSESTVDDAFAGYARAVKGVRGAIVAPLVDPHAPDANPSNGIEPSAPFFGNTGLFDARPATAAPLGPWNPDYMGNLPVRVQPKVIRTNPWEHPEGL
jgi:hypothetical protein